MYLPSLSVYVEGLHDFIDQHEDYGDYNRDNFHHVNRFGYHETCDGGGLDCSWAFVPYCRKEDRPGINKIRNEYTRLISEWAETISDASDDPDVLATALRELSAAILSLQN